MIENLLGDDSASVLFFKSGESVRVLSKYEDDFAETVREARNTAEIDEQLTVLSLNILRDAGLAVTAVRLTAANYALCRHVAEMLILTADTIS